MADYSIGYSGEALQDLKDIFMYISINLKEPGTAAAQIKRICDEIRTLSNFPKRNISVEWEPWASLGMRQMSVDNFMIFYIVSDNVNSVQVVRIFYGKRNIPNIINNM